MKSALLTCFLFFSLLCKSQTNHVEKLLPGKYETFTKENKSKWERGDILLLDENKYRISSEKETGEYRFSVTAQRIFFTSGPLKSFYAKASLNNNVPVIVLPVSENQELGVKLHSEIWGYYRH